MSKLLWGVIACVAGIVAVIIIVVATADNPTASPSPAVPAGDTSSDYSAAIKLVQDSMTAVSADTLYAWEYRAGALEDGVAVLVNDNGAYWVKDNVLYAANGSAKTWSPNLDYSPTGIDFNTVQDSVKG